MPVCVSLAGRERMTVNDRMKGGEMKLARLYAGAAAAGGGREGAREGKRVKEVREKVKRNHNICLRKLWGLTAHDPQGQPSIIFSLIHRPQFCLSASFHKQASIRIKPCDKRSVKKTSLGEGMYRIYRYTEDIAASGDGCDLRTTALRSSYLRFRAHRCETSPMHGALDKSMGLMP